MQQNRCIRLTRHDVVGVFARSLTCRNWSFEYSQFQGVFLAIGKKKSRSTGRAFSAVAMGAVDVKVSHGSIVERLALILIVDKGRMCCFAQEAF